MKISRLTDNEIAYWISIICLIAVGVLYLGANTSSKKWEAMYTDLEVEYRVLVDDYNEQVNLLDTATEELHIQTEYTLLLEDYITYLYCPLVYGGATYHYSYLDTNRRFASEVTTVSIMGEPLRTPPMNIIDCR